MLRRCIVDGCNVLTEQSRCPAHRKAQRDKYKHGWQVYAARSVAAHVEHYGFICPGWHTPAHPTRDLVLDHHEGVMCRQCNSRKQASGHG